MKLSIDASRLGPSQPMRLRRPKCRPTPLRQIGCLNLLSSVSVPRVTTLVPPLPGLLPKGCSAGRRGRAGSRGEGARTATRSGLSLLRPHFACRHSKRLLFSLGSRLRFGLGWLVVRRFEIRERWGGRSPSRRRMRGKEGVTPSRRSFYDGGKPRKKESAFSLFLTNHSDLRSGETTP